MTRDAVAAERALDVREAARAWRRAGFVSGEVLDRILPRYPDDRHRFGPGFRALAFIFTGIGVFATVGLSMVLIEPVGSEDWAVLLGFWAVVCFGLTELQTGAGRRAQAGAESATAYSSVALAAFGFVALSDAFGAGSGGRGFAMRVLGACLILCVFTAWRWGDRLLSAGAAFSTYALLALTSQGRVLWLVVSLALIPLCLKGARSPRLSPSHRGGATVVGAVAIVALYGAVHIWSFDQRLIESVHSHSPAQAPLLWRPLSILATALLPPLLLFVGWRRREPLFIYSGLLLIGISIATIRLYHAAIPLSVALVLIGAACLAVALGVRRWLRSGHAGERDGFTADPLFDDTNRTEAIRSVVAMATFSPPAGAAPSRPAFEGGGGSFGGGGASGTY
jgi:hypothetical protein